MKQLLALCLAVFAAVCAAQTTTVQPSGTQTSPNLVYTTVNPYPCTTCTSPGSWTGFVQTTSTGGGYSGGNQPGYNATTGQFLFGYTQGTVAYNYAVSQALKDSGMSWLGYNYSWEYYNQDTARGTLGASVACNSATAVIGLWTKQPKVGPP